MQRSKWKGPFISWSLFRLIKSKKKKKFKIWNRSSIILPSFIGLVFFVYNGYSFKKLIINSKIVYSCFGEFVPTRRFFKK